MSVPHFGHEAKIVFTSKSDMSDIGVVSDHTHQSRAYIGVSLGDLLSLVFCSLLEVLHLCPFSVFSRETHRE